jgi:hypothetical protein
MRTRILQDGRNSSSRRCFLSWCCLLHAHCLNSYTSRLQVGLEEEITGVYIKIQLSVVHFCSTESEIPWEMFTGDNEATICVLIKVAMEEV